MTSRQRCPRSAGRSDRTGRSPHDPSFGSTGLVVGRDHVGELHDGRPASPTDLAEAFNAVVLPYLGTITQLETVFHVTDRLDLHISVAETGPAELLFVWLPGGETPSQFARDARCEPARWLRQRVSCPRPADPQVRKKRLRTVAADMSRDLVIPRVTASGRTKQRTFAVAVGPKERDLPFSINRGDPDDEVAVGRRHRGKIRIGQASQACRCVGECCPSFGPPLRHVLNERVCLSGTGNPDPTGPCLTIVAIPRRDSASKDHSPVNQPQNMKVGSRSISSSRRFTRR